LQHVLEAVPYKIHAILTEPLLLHHWFKPNGGGIQFAEQPRNRHTIYYRPMRFKMNCEANRIEHHLIKTNHPWTNSQVKRMNRKIKDATVKHYHFDSHH
jgi:hypothetical protein